MGCGVCEAACPSTAIKLVTDAKIGVPVPKINEIRCNGCGTCLRICYGYNIDQIINCRKSTSLLDCAVGNFANCYIGYAKDKLLRRSSSSGGVITALLLYALEKRLIDGAIVTRMEAGNPPKARAFIATTADEIISAAGSKYCPVSFAESLTNLEEGKRYAVVGLPCHIYGIKKLAKSNPKIRKCIYLYLGLLCGGMPSFLATLYLLKTYKMEGECISKFEYRGGEWPGRLLIEGKMPSNQQVKVSVPYPEYWRNAYEFFFPYVCTLCTEGFNKLADVSIGDAWFQDSTKLHKNNVSLIITRTETGERIILDAFQNKIIQITPINAEDILKCQQGLIQFKFLTFRARVILYRILKKKIPVFNLDKVPITGLWGYISAITLHVGRSLALRKRLWWLFNIYVSGYSFVKIVKNYEVKIREKIGKFLNKVRKTDL